MAIWQAVSTLIELCSVSMNSQSKPQVPAMVAMSTVRAWRSPMPRASPPAASFALVPLIRVGMVRSILAYRMRRMKIGTDIGKLAGLLSLAEIEEAGRRHLPRPLRAYVSGGVEDNVSLMGNRAAFHEYGFVPRVLVNVAERSQATTLFGRSYAMPAGIAPMGICAMTAYRGDVVLARGAAAENALMVFSGSSLIRLE